MTFTELVDYRRQRLLRQLCSATRVLRVLDLPGGDCAPGSDGAILAVEPVF